MKSRKHITNSFTAEIGVIVCTTVCSNTKFFAKPFVALYCVRCISHLHKWFKVNGLCQIHNVIY